MDNIPFKVFIEWRPLNGILQKGDLAAHGLNNRSVGLLWRGDFLMVFFKLKIFVFNRKKTFGRVLYSKDVENLP